MNTTSKKQTGTTEVVPEATTAIIAQENNIVKSDADIDGYIAKRQAFITKVNAICVEGKDFHVIQGKKSLAKGGAEKIASIFNWQAKFEKDTEALEMLGVKEGLVAFKCSLTNSHFVGEGRGAATLQKNNGDPNKTLKMAQKSAFIDAVLRASGLSDFFTQDLEDMPREEISQPQQYSRPQQQAMPATTVKASQKQLDLIAKLAKERNYTKDDIKGLVKGFGFTEITGGRDGSASKVIDYLMKAPKLVKEELPVIQLEPIMPMTMTRGDYGLALGDAGEMAPEEKEMVDGIPF